MFRTIIVTLAITAAAVLLSGGLTGCHTVEGAGEDIQGVGRGVSEGASGTREMLGGNKSKRHEY